MDIYPAYFVLAGLIVYLFAYFVYARRYDKKVWQPDPKATTPAHMYMDGVEFFPSSRYILYGFQFKGIAGAAPIVGPFVALQFGWVPALLWILVGNFFIGWIHDYGSIFMGVRNEGKTLGPLTYELISPRARSCLMGFLVFYLITIIAAFFNVCGTLYSARGGGLIFTIFIVIAGILGGALLYKAKVHVGIVTVLGIIIMLIGLYVGAVVFPLSTGEVSYEIAVVVVALICLFSAVVPIIWFAQPVNYMAFYPCIAGIIVLIIGALASPITNVTVIPPALTTNWLYPSMSVGPIWPILFVSIACGAISGWHSLVSTSGTARQLDLETDALPIGAGSMLTEGLLALSALAAYMSFSTPEMISAGSFGGFAAGASRLVAPILFTSEDNPALKTFFMAYIAIYAVTILQLAIRFFRLALTEITAPSPALRLSIGNKWVASIIGLVIGALFAWTGSFINLWTLFGGSNQLMAGLALILVSVYLAGVKKPSKYTLGPAIFMIITCEAALAYEAYLFFNAVLTNVPIASGRIAGYREIALGLNAIFGIIGIILVILGIIVAYDAAKALSKAWKAKKESQ
jgi:carbon starvation protein